jgi:hypothetical protein
MVVKTELANGNFEVFETSNYVISKTKDFHPLLCKVSIYDNGKKIKSVSRPFKFIYKHFIFKSEKVQKLLVELENKKENQIQKQN